MLNRRGITLVELMVGIVMMGIIGVALLKVFTSLMGASGAQVRIAASQGEARIGTLMLPQEFREIGYDTVPTLPSGGSASSDLIAIAGNQLSFWASRGVGITCGTPTTTEFKIRRGYMGQRAPLLTDRILLFLEVDRNTGTDDRWVVMDVAAIDMTSTCDGDPAITFTLNAAPNAWPSTPMAISQHFVGGPIRWQEAVEYAPLNSGGEWFVGRRSISLSEATATPVIGPLSGATGVSFTYFNAAGTAIAPASANARINTRSIGITLSTVTEGNVSLAGSTRNRTVSTYPVVTRVSLRNTLRP